ncbi:MAG TPA: histidine kinase [Actinomycetales bacterium]|nr:histidine kinase [Actinomycetales bacterium]
MRGVGRVDVVVAAVFVSAAVAEAVVVHPSPPGLLALNASGALWLAALAVRRSRPLLSLAVVCGAAVLGSVLTQHWWPDASDGGGVWLFAIMLASFSLGSHARGRVLAGGILLPLAVAVAVDVTARSGWALVSGVVFVAGFTGLVPTTVGRLVRSRRDRLQALDSQRETIVEGQRVERESAVLAERLRTTERLQPTLVEGLQGLAEMAEAGAPADAIETRARHLLERTRGEVVSLTAPIDPPPAAAVPGVDHLAVTRTAAQPWVAVSACALAAGLTAESTQALGITGPTWPAIVLSLLVGLAVALAWWRPVLAAAASLSVAAVFSRLVVPLDGSLSETALVLALAFAVAALSRREAAAVGLVACWVGQLVGVGTQDPFGEGLAIAMFWAGGLVLNEMSRLVEQGRANNELIAAQQAEALRRAVVGERLRFAREVHDAIGASLTVIVLQAGGARRLAATSPDRAREVMRDVAAAAREGVTALQPVGAGVDVSRLVDRARAAGLPVEADVEAIGQLSPDVQLLVHRVVQEALTNVLRHAPGSHATVHVRLGGGAVHVRVTNTAGTRPAASPGTGRGLAGMRERIAACTGRVSWSALSDGGFEVQALVPLTRVAEVAS